MIENGGLMICDLCLVDEMMGDPAAVSVEVWEQHGWAIESHDGFPDVHVCSAGISIRDASTPG